MNLPPDFISNIQNTFEEEGHAFLKALPDLIAEASARWGLRDVVPAPELSYNFVAFARRGEVPSPNNIGFQQVGQEDPAPTRDVVLKMGVPRDELRSEMAALTLFNGEGACQLLDYDEERCWLLLERLRPGQMLVEMDDDEERTHIAAEVMKRIWVSQSALGGVPAAEDGGLSSKFIHLTDWFHGGFERLRNHFNGGTGPLVKKLVERVESPVDDFFEENHRPVLMHGDFHHYNILSSERGWLVIDPKGVIGPAGYEVGPFMLNPWGMFSDGINRQLILRRIDILDEHLGLERERIIEWSLAHAVLSAWWGIEDNTGWEYSMNCAEMIASL